MKLIANNKKVVIALLLLFMALGVYAYQKYFGHTRSTENAYINADVVNVAALVKGQVLGVYITENQHVHKGDKLFDIDPRPYAIALEHAQADLASAKQSARQDHADVNVARAEVQQIESDLHNARVNYQRDQDLLTRHFIPQQKLDDAHTRVADLEASLQQASAKLNRAQAVPEKLNERGDVMRAQAAIDQAKLDLQNTQVYANQDGQISNLSLTAGSMVGIGNPLFAIIADNSFHIDANFKETELGGIHAGQLVDIHIDMYPEQHFLGAVESLSGGTGTAFSLLPPQNATGNWVKIAQRVPVRIKFAQMDADHPLRIGATATVTVELR